MSRKSGNRFSDKDMRHSTDFGACSGERAMIERLAAIGAVTVLAAALTFGDAAVQGASAQLSQVETLYAELAKLPKAERSNRIEDGARREGKIVLVHTLRGALGAGHVELF